MLKICDVTVYILIVLRFSWMYMSINSHIFDAKFDLHDKVYNYGCG